MTTTFRKLALSAIIPLSTLAALTMTSCTKDEPLVCSTGLTGSDCKTELRVSYYNSYKGSGFDNAGGTYTDWTARFTALGTEPTKMNMQLLNDKLASMEALTVMLTSNTTFNIDSKTSGTSTFSGTGTIDASKVTLSITEKENLLGVTTTYILTFNNMVKQ
jgi:hypothetical protein